MNQIEEVKIFSEGKFKKDIVEQINDYFEIICKQNKPVTKIVLLNEFSDGVQALEDRANEAIAELKSEGIYYDIKYINSNGFSQIIVILNPDRSFDMQFDRNNGYMTCFIKILSKNNPLMPL